MSCTTECTTAVVCSNNSFLINLTVSACSISVILKGKFRSSLAVQGNNVSELQDLMNMLEQEALVAQQVSRPASGEELGGE